MDESSALKPVPPPSSNLRRRNSITVPVVVPSKLTLFASAACSFPNSKTTASSPSPPLPLDFELVSIKSSSSPSLVYTSLRDILPSSLAAINSPTAASAQNSGYEISIRNRLVKQAAWAYLQPMSSSPGSSGPHLLRRLWLRFSGCLGFLNIPIISSITHVFNQIFRVVQISFVS